MSVSTPFRQYATLIRDIVTTPTLAGLKKALNAGNAQAKYPIGTEIEDTWNGNSNPLIVAQYLDSTNNSAYGDAEGVLLIRKYVEPTSMQFDGRNNSDYTISSIYSYLQNDYIRLCSDDARENIAEINIPYNSVFGLEYVPSKFFLMSTTEVMGAASGEGIAWELWKQRTGLTSPSGNTNSGRAILDRTNFTKNWWLRSKYNSAAARCVSTSGSVYYNSVSYSLGVLPACFIAKG